MNLIYESKSEYLYCVRWSFRCEVINILKLTIIPLVVSKILEARTETIYKINKLLMKDYFLQNELRHLSKIQLISTVLWIIKIMQNFSRIWRLIIPIILKFFKVEIMGQQKITRWYVFKNTPAKYIAIGTKFSSEWKLEMVLRVIRKWHEDITRIERNN